MIELVKGIRTKRGSPFPLVRFFIATTQNGIKICLKLVSFRWHSIFLEMQDPDQNWLGYVKGLIVGCIATKVKYSNDWCKKALKKLKIKQSFMIF